MKLAIMQPYFFPYLGYWQLIHHVDRFVIYDDVNYINRGWINRNRILINGVPSYITIPLKKASQNKRICDIFLQTSTAWRNKFVKSIEYTYRKTAHFFEVFPIIEQLIFHEVDNLSDYLTYQIQMITAFMGIKTKFVVASQSYKDKKLSGQKRIIDICKREGAFSYFNLQGGLNLYNAEAFFNAGIDLRFIVMRHLPYKQRKSKLYSPNLSIIDLLFEIGPERIIHYLDAYDLEGG